ncbi:6-phosphogluconolactonase [Falsarthrobacter nasiphocae]|uniref:6-phosphogluconolactonase n=1 Tax=Falsarthrobacter nasiphocae TaxID=189863 RepID=A0AAE4C5K0_9MICC|nr:6-phosphogluconolactonase [Falsarthrobacter nasiphocae]MDR6891157.1 6-phosphogluconolactonase [Falsarthrobacter nasiphocae]
MSADPVTTVVLPTAEDVSRRAAAALLAEIERVQDEGRTAHVVLTGGTIGIRLLADARRLLATDAASLDPTRLELWWGDERFVPRDSEDRNERQAREALLDHLSIPEANTHHMGSSDEFGTAEEAADAYAALLQSRAPEGEDLPRFDVLLLGMGPDGHTASLFPGTGLVFAEGVTTAVHNSPKPPADRVSLTLTAINAAEEVWIAATGPEKAPMVARALAGAAPDEVPAGAPRGRRATRWYLDSASAGAAAPAGQSVSQDDDDDA